MYRQLSGVEFGVRVTDALCTRCIAGVLCRDAGQAAASAAAMEPPTSLALFWPALDAYWLRPAGADLTLPMGWVDAFAVSHC